jgi:hypothetical protein
MPKSTIQARYVLHNGRMQWRVLTPKDLGGGAKYFGDDKDAADKRVKDLEKIRRNGPNSLLGYSPGLQSAIILAVNELGDDADKILDAVRFWKQNAARESRSLPVAIKDCVAAKRASGCRHRYLVALENTLTRFSLGREESDVHSLTMRDCETWINQEGLSNATKRSRQIDLGTFFSFCLKRHYCTANPIANLERHKFDDKPPAIFTPEECEVILHYCAKVCPKALATLALQMFAGLRPYESYKIAWSDLASGQIVMDGKNTKTRMRRIVKINPTLKAWLDFAKEQGSPLPLPDAPRYMTRVRAPILDWRQDGLRHSFVSYSYEIYGEIETAKQAGHSIDMLLRHYRALVTRPDAERFWNILPTLAF